MFIGKQKAILASAIKMNKTTFITLSANKFLSARIFTTIGIKFIKSNSRVNTNYRCLIGAISYNSLTLAINNIHQRRPTAISLSGRCSCSNIRIINLNYIHQLAISNNTNIATNILSARVLGIFACYLYLKSVIIQKSFYMSSVNKISFHLFFFSLIFKLICFSFFSNGINCR